MHPWSMKKWAVSCLLSEEGSGVFFLVNFDFIHQSADAQRETASQTIDLIKVLLITSSISLLLVYPIT